MGILFGTDGIRGVAGTPPLDRDTIYRTGYWLTRHLKGLHQRPRLLIARDTRVSGPWIEGILQRAIEEVGGVVENCGVISTPAIAYLTALTGAQAGIVISASHNPYQDNGIKIFSSHGMKFNGTVESSLEKEILSGLPAVPPDMPATDSFEAESLREDAPRYRELYTQYLHQCVPADFSLDGMKLIIDCANGALSAIAPGFLAGFGGKVQAIHCLPDGRNINLHSGALHLDSLRDSVLVERADLGIAFDGDADRAMLVDGKGVIHDGDDILYLLARYSPLDDAPRIVVGTVMANLGLEVALEKLGFQLVRTAVGDRYVLEEMLRLGAVIGGEQSGHIIQSRIARTGDGLLTALKVLQILNEQRQEIADLCRPLQRFPQVVRNVYVNEKIPFSDITGLGEAESACRERLGPRSRILLRYSGTEKLARVMVEGEDESEVNRAARQLASIFEQLS